MAFDGIADVSGTIKIEGEKISVKFLPTVPTDSQGTVEWNIPTSIAGCATKASINSSYCGIVVLASKTQVGRANIPQSGTRYDADPTLDDDLHAGDKIGDALVIGAFYEGDKKAKGLDLTTSMVVSDYNPDQTYYVAVYAVTCELEYHEDGIRAYSDAYGTGVSDTPDRPSVTAVVMNDGDGVKLTDGTNLDSGREYGIEFDLNTNFPGDSNEDNRITVTFDGSEGQTYGDMLDTINDQLKDIDNPPRSPEPPTFGSNHWNQVTKQLQTFDGTKYNAVDDVIVGVDDPSITPAGSYWFDKVNKSLKQRNTNVPPSTVLWDVIDTILFPSNPLAPLCDTVWFNGMAGYIWSGTTWCETQTFVQNTDPSLMKIGTCGQYWYNKSTLTLNRYNIATQEWEEKYAIFWPDAPDALSTGTLWYSSTDLVLRSRIQFGNVKDWNMEVNFVTGEVTPIPTPNLYWLKESTMEFTKYDGTSFVPVDVLEWHEDPASVTSCELWWDDQSDTLHEFDVVNLQWDEVASLTESDEDPLNPEVIEDKSFWHNLADNTFNVWDGSYYSPSTSFIDYPTDPTAIVPTDNVAWVNTSNGEVNIPAVAGGWELATPLIESDFDPENIPVGKAWFDEGTGTLKLWSGITWITVPYTNKPIKNKKGELWIDTDDGILRSWDGKKWVPADAKIVASLDKHGNILFVTRDAGCNVALLMLIPGQTYKREINSQPGVTYGGGPKHYSGYKSVYTDNPFDAPLYIDSELREDQFLFNELPAKVQPVVIGSNTPTPEPGYATLGVGTDGTPDERRELMHSVRVQLGYPTVEVELTDEQLDTCITGAFESLRKRSDIAYDRGFYLLDIRPGFQNYELTNSCIGFNKIVTVMGAFRRSGAFSGGVSSNGIFDQMFSQQLYGTAGGGGGFDMTTLYLSQQYLELVEMMFATKLNFHFRESNRTLYFHQDFHTHERILLDTTIERTEQDLFKDRWVKSWIERFTLAGARLILAEIRGKYAALPGAGGGVSLNAADLLSTSAADFQDCYAQLEDYVASRAETYGAFDFVMG